MKKTPLQKMIEVVEKRYNDNKTLWNEWKETLLKEERELQQTKEVQSDVSNSVFSCPVCGEQWDTSKHKSCSCGAFIGKH